MSKRALLVLKEEGPLGIPRKALALLNRHRRQRSFKAYVIQKSFNGVHFKLEIADIWDEDWFASDVESGHSELPWILDNLRDGMTVVDCGAHHGFYTLMIANRVGPDGHVYAIEALPENALALQRNVALNNLENVTVFNTAVGSREGMLEFRTITHGIRESNGRPVLNENMEGNLSLPMTTLDRLIENIHVDFLKIDVEGFELEVLRGATKLLAQHPGMDLEIHSEIFSDGEKTIEEIFEIIKPSSYEEVQIETAVNQPTQKFDAKSHNPSAIAKLKNTHLLIKPGSWIDEHVN